MKQKNKNKDAHKIYNSLLDKITNFLKFPAGRDEKLLRICKMLHDNIPHYDWVGFYIADEKKQTLSLGPFSGEPTEHTKIKFGEGICGQAAQKKDIFIVQDVSKETNYLSCSPAVKSEIVLPIFKEGKIVAELDIDSHSKSPFTEEDEIFLNKICEMVAFLF